jgi:hypothetical protein
MHGPDLAGLVFTSGFEYCHSHPTSSSGYFQPQEMAMNIDFTNPIVIVSIVAAIVLIVAAIAIAAHQERKRSAELRSRFGSEYERVVREEGARRKAEARLLDRMRRVSHLNIRPLSAAELDRFRSAWDGVQARFIDHPRGAVAEADELVNAVMMARGFPMEKFEQRAADISVNHSHLVQAYRSANAITMRVESNQATTEELRTAMIHYRALFDELLEMKSTIPAEERRAIA